MNTMNKQCPVGVDVSDMIIKVHRKWFFIACVLHYRTTIRNIHINETESRLNTKTLCSNRSSYAKHDDDGTEYETEKNTDIHEQSYKNSCTNMSQHCKRMATETIIYSHISGQWRALKCRLKNCIRKWMSSWFIVAILSDALSTRR